MVTYFSILDRDESDYFPVNCKLNLPCSYTPEVPKIREENSRQGTTGTFKWFDDKLQPYVDMFLLKFSEINDVIINQLPHNINQAVATLTSLYKTCAIQVGLFTKHRETPAKSQPPCWNDTCDQKKCRKYHMLRPFRTSNSESDLCLYKQAKSEFKSFTKCRKLLYETDKRRELTRLSNNPRKFWNLLKGPKSSSCHVLIYCIYMEHDFVYSLCALILDELIYPTHQFYSLNN
ncbi:hypothetical protein ACF0H5_023141 [Mactra antiquata]